MEGNLAPAKRQTTLENLIWLLLWQPPLVRSVCLLESVGAQTWHRLHTPDNWHNAAWPFSSPAGERQKSLAHSAFLVYLHAPHMHVETLLNFSFPKFSKHEASFTNAMQTMQPLWSCVCVIPNTVYTQLGMGNMTIIYRPTVHYYYIVWCNTVQQHQTSSSKIYII